MDCLSAWPLIEAQLLQFSSVCVSHFLLLPHILRLIQEGEGVRG